MTDTHLGRSLGRDIGGLKRYSSICDRTLGLAIPGLPTGEHLRGSPRIAGPRDPGIEKPTSICDRTTGPAGQWLPWEKAHWGWLGPV